MYIVEGPIDAALEDELVRQSGRVLLLNWLREHDEAGEVHHREPVRTAAAHSPMDWH